MNGEYLTTAFKRLRNCMSRSDTRDEDLDDSLQDAFCRLWARRESIRDDDHAERTLAVTAKNIRIDNIRRQKAHPETPLEAVQELSDGETAVEWRELYAEVDRLVKSNLSERDREILYHREKDGWEFSEIAEMYGLSEANVRLIVSRTRKQIRELYRLKNKDR